jgi:1-acyl-sn-glycerol-3-phosphate acyltransferase
VYVKIGKPIDTRPFAEDDREGLAKAVRDVIIAQSLELGGKGGDPERVVAAAGVEGEAQVRRTAS